MKGFVFVGVGHGLRSGYWVIAAIIPNDHMPHLLNTYYILDSLHSLSYLIFEATPWRSAPHLLFTHQEADGPRYWCPQLETNRWERMPGSPRGLENSLKIGPLQNHIWSWVEISYKVFISIPTRIKQNHPRRTHKKTYLQKWLPMSPCQKEKSEREKERREKKIPGLNRIFCQTHGSCNKSQKAKCPSKSNASCFISGKWWVQYI